MSNVIETGSSSYLKTCMMSLFNVSLSCFGGHGECFLCHPEPKTTKILLQIIGSFLDEGWLESQVLAATLLTATLQK